MIKVDQPKIGDDTRYWGPPFIREASDEQPPMAAYFHCANRNKQSIAIDITHADGQQIIRDLITDADVLIENYTPRVMDNFGLTYEVLREINPRLVMMSMPAPVPPFVVAAIREVPVFRPAVLSRRPGSRR